MNDMTAPSKSTPSLEEQLQLVFDEIDTKLQAIESGVLLQRQDLDKTVNQLAILVNECQNKPYASLMQLNLQGTVELCTRFAALYVNVLTDLKHNLSLNSVLVLTKQKRFMSHVLEVSGYGGNRAVLKLLLQKAREKKTRHLTENPAMVRAVMLGGVGDLEPADLVELTLEHSETSALLAIGLLLDRLPLTVTGDAGRTFLLEEYNPYDALRPLDQYRALISNIWMLCSYSTSPRKHDIKKHLNNWFKRVHKARGIQPKPLGSVKHVGNTDNKPVMAVIAETFKSVHAMYRWYAPMIKQLQRDYYLVMVGLKADVDEQSISLFDEFIEVPEEEMNLQPVLNQCTPDIAWFMSVGMRAWSISLANLRWAPLQAMSFGHPATSHSTEMDVVFATPNVYGGAGVVSENTLLLNSRVSNVAQAHKDLKLPPPAVLNDSTVQIAVPCNAMKINLNFVAALKEIERLASKPVRFMFFPNEYGVGHLSTEQRLRSHFPTALVARRTGYEAYLNLLNQNHLALSPFPFGNATSTIDCMVLGLPVISLIGTEPHSRTDFDILDSLGLADYCVADSVENYVQGVVRYLNEPGLLEELRGMVQSKNFMQEHTVLDNEFSVEMCAALNWACKHRDEVAGPRGLVFEGAGRWQA
ncbi:glycosyl transferase [Limnobacter thiooxidans]|uniref:Glycosyl transferase n=2 Tax=Limnobacter thiooxidans TaxID=131080 RepID=A0AA86MFT5_9BURK|nr:glycosyl transferase [Limnobacter thiooxidans]